MGYPPMKRRYKFLVLGFLLGVLLSVMMVHWYKLEARVIHMERYLTQLSQMLAG